jgi:hypothetical protein
MHVTNSDSVHGKDSNEVFRVMGPGNLTGGNEFLVRIQNTPPEQT